jgi:gamma-glutamylaminecyclotransferase
MRQERSAMHLVFIYGTLKRGFQNDRLRPPAARFLACCTTVERYPLVIGGRWFSPYLLDDPGDGELVSGELFAVDDEDLTHLDRLEGTDLPGGYRRIVLRVRSHSDRALREAFTYVKSRSAVDPIHGKPLAVYTNDRRYVPPAERDRVFD